MNLTMHVRWWLPYLQSTRLASIKITLSAALLGLAMAHPPHPLPHELLSQVNASWRCILCTAQHKQHNLDVAGSLCHLMAANGILQSGSKSHYLCRFTLRTSAASAISNAASCVQPRPFLAQ